MEDKKESKNEVNKTAIIVGLMVSLIIGGSILGYGYLDYKYKKESLEQKQKSEEQAMLKATQEQEESKREREDSKEALDTCIADAEESYRNSWFSECKTRGLLTSRCISLNELTFDEYAKQNNILQDKKVEASADFYKERGECSCSLPLDVAKTKTEFLQKEKDDCFKKYPQR